jgi:AcrR family transcriptional regulator
MDVRARILEAALGLLAESGAHELTQPRVARAAGVRQSHLTYYFPTRAALMQALARHSIGRLAGELARARERGPSQLARAIAAASSDKRIARVMLGLVAAADRDPAIRRQFRRFVAEVRELMAPTLAAGGLRAGPACIAFFHSVVIGCAVLQLARDSAEARSEARAVLRMAARAIAKGRR